MALCQIDEREVYALIYLNHIVQVPWALCTFSQFDYSLIIMKMPNMMACEECCGNEEEKSHLVHFQWS